MVHRRTMMPTCDDREGEPFATPEDAWVWYSHCQQARDDGVRLREGMGVVARPCVPDDIAREVRRLYQRRILRSSHLRVLARFGRDGGTAVGDDENAGRLWREALDRLATPLKTKGIVA